MATLGAMLAPLLPWHSPAAPGAAGIDPLPAWAVGQGGEWNWDVIEAATEDEARRQWLYSSVSGGHCEYGGEAGAEAACECDACNEFRSLDVERKPEWDGQNVQAGDVRWFEDFGGAYCARCGGETFREDGGRVVSGTIVCEDCLTLADWEVIDPAYAAELRADLED